MNNWKLDVNTVGDTTNNIVMLNGELMPVSNAKLCLCEGNTPHLVIDIPIDGVMNTLELKTNDNNGDIDQVITATSKEDKKDV